MSKLIDEKGKKYGKLNVISFDKTKGKWLCQCDCGNIRYIKGNELRQGNYKTCGCSRKDKEGTYRNDLRGMRFTRLLVLEWDSSQKKWLCQCDCGKKVYVKPTYLQTGHTKSCGCLAKDLKIDKKIKKDERFPRLYSIWHHMKGRCYNPNQESFSHYGAKGIKVCDEWKHDFPAFFYWAIEHGYEEVDGDLKDKMSIDRIDSSKDYSPQNCRWITYSENCARVSKVNALLQGLSEKANNNYLVQQYLERKIANAQKNIELNKKTKSGNYFFRKPTYCYIRNNDGTQQYLFRNLKTVAEFLDITYSSLNYRIKNKNGVLNESWKIEKLTKEEFDNIKSKGVEVIK